MKQVCHLLLVLGVTLLLPPGVARAQSHIPTYLPDFMPAGIVVNNMLRNQDRMAERRRGTPQRSKASSTIMEGRPLQCGGADRRHLPARRSSAAPQRARGCWAPSLYTKKAAAMDSQLEPIFSGT